MVYTPSARTTVRSSSASAHHSCALRSAVRMPRSSRTARAPPVSRTQSTTRRSYTRQQRAWRLGCSACCSSAPTRRRSLARPTSCACSTCTCAVSLCTTSWRRSRMRLRAPRKRLRQSKATHQSLRQSMATHQSTAAPPATSHRSRRRCLFVKTAVGSTPRAPRGTPSAALQGCSRRSPAQVQPLRLHLIATAPPPLYLATAPPPLYLLDVCRAHCPCLRALVRPTGKRSTRRAPLGPARGHSLILIKVVRGTPPTPATEVQQRFERVADGSVLAHEHSAILTICDLAGADAPGRRHGAARGAAPSAEHGVAPSASAAAHERGMTVSTSLLALANTVRHLADRGPATTRSPLAPGIAPAADVSPASVIDAPGAAAQAHVAGLGPSTLRDCALTRLLRASLGGACKTTFLATVSQVRHLPCISAAFHRLPPPSMAFAELPFCFFCFFCLPRSCRPSRTPLVPRGRR